MSGVDRLSERNRTKNSNLQSRCQNRSDETLASDYALLPLRAAQKPGSQWRYREAVAMLDRSVSRSIGTPVSFRSE